MAKALFICGNKRSGTSHLVRLLNLHPQVFLSHESDIIWILYQFHNRMPFTPYPEDSMRGMQDALNRCGHLLDGSKSPVENFFAFQSHLMENGSSWLPAMKKTCVSWVGDKKPFQYADPELKGFILDNFHEANFIHLVRHPFSVAASAAEFNKTPDGDFWQGLSLEAMVGKWTENEKKVLQLKEDTRAHVIDIKYEDLCKDTGTELQRIFRFLDLNVDDTIIKKAVRKTYYRKKNIPDIRLGQETLSIMELYGYVPHDVTKPYPKRKAINVYWRKKIKL
ncbi:sulfotransferase [Thermodesulfobacteriota bacterium]